ncbi:hypothetical protein SAMN05444141_104349 [Pseudovibrio denitrificans]|uniref:T3SS negative regulator,GrlR n=1 Tax=Pseudovibrio denitrificans TaxID=258256 RepID=A0A1I7BUH8_9HYPH|nr:hypothetical protein [Pseudovibrio denitrificans]SFT90813.1 hypothetical protein SAMN05444141_104349 [Pseudovibrio denitrificans]
MKAVICAALSLFIFGHTTTVAEALSIRVGLGDKITTFSNVTPLHNKADANICRQRYGKSFITKGHAATIEKERLVTTSEGQKIELIYLGGYVGSGVYSIENQYKFTFPNEGNGQPVKLQLAATGFIGAGRATGVFSDGTCVGEITIELTTLHNGKTYSSKQSNGPDKK